MQNAHQSFAAMKELKLMRYRLKVDYILFLFLFPPPASVGQEISRNPIT